MSHAPRPSLWFRLSALTAAVAVAYAVAQTDYTWDDAVTTGAFEAQGNWQPNGYPSDDDAITFAALDQTTTVNFSDDEYVDILNILNSDVVLNDGGGDWGLSVWDTILVGDPAAAGGDHASLTIESGYLSGWDDWDDLEALLAIVTGTDTADGVFVNAAGELYAYSALVGLGGGLARNGGPLTGRLTVEEGYGEFAELVIGGVSADEMLAYLTEQEAYLDGELQEAPDEPVGGIGIVTVSGPGSTPRESGNENLLVWGGIAVGSFGGNGELTITDGAEALVESWLGLDLRDRQVGDWLIPMAVGTFGGTGTVTVDGGATLGVDWFDDDDDGGADGIYYDGWGWSVTVGNAMGLDFWGAFSEVETDGNGMFNVDGAGTEVYAEGFLVGASNGFSGVMNVTDGAMVSCDGYLLAVTIPSELYARGRQSTPGAGTINVDGAGTSVDAFGIGAYGLAGPATLNITGGATTESEVIYVFSQALIEGTSAAVEINGAGSLATAYAVLVSAGGDGVPSEATLSVSDGGMLNVLADTTRQTGLDGMLMIQAGTGLIGRGDRNGAPLADTVASVTVDGAGTFLTPKHIVAGADDGALAMMTVRNQGLVETHTATFDAGSALVVTGGGWFGVEELMIGPGGLLTGDGTIAPYDDRGGIGGNVRVEGRAAPGNSIGALTILGSYTQEPGSVLEIEVEPGGTADQLAVGEQATLNGGTVEVIPEAGEYAPGTAYKIIDAQGGVTGTFDGVDVVAAARNGGLRFGLDYETDAVWLRLLMGGYVDSAMTPNQTAIARFLDAVNRGEAGDDMAEFLGRLDGLDDTQLRGALDGISPSELDDVTKSGLEEANALLDALFQHLSLSVPGGRGGTARTTPDSRQGTPSILAYESPAAAQDGWVWWAEALGTYTQYKETSESEGYRNRSGGAVFGGDCYISANTVVGLGLAYSRSTLDWTNNAGDGHTESLFATASGSWQSEDLYVNGALGIGHTWFDSQRLVPTGLRAKGEHNGLTFVSMLGGGYDFHTDKLTLGPTARIQYAALHEEGFSEEEAGALNMQFDRSTAESCRTNLGLRALYNGAVLRGHAVRPELRLEWMHEFVRDARRVDGALEGLPGTSIGVWGNDPLQDAVIIGAGLRVDASENVTFRLDYDLTQPIGSSDYKAGHALFGRISWQF